MDKKTIKEAEIKRHNPTLLTSLDTKRGRWRR